MGGKTWSREEEVYFWTQVIPNSPVRVHSSLRPEKDWEVLAEEMTRAMGKGARRVYTKLGLYEHFYQNCANMDKKSFHFSANCVDFAKAYIADKNEEMEAVGDTVNAPASYGSRGTQYQVRISKPRPSQAERHPRLAARTENMGQAGKNGDDEDDKDANGLSSNVPNEPHRLLSAPFVPSGSVSAVGSAPGMTSYSNQPYSNTLTSFTGNASVLASAWAPRPLPATDLTSSPFYGPLSRPAAPALGSAYAPAETVAHQLTLSRDSYVRSHARIDDVPYIRADPRVHSNSHVQGNPYIEGNSDMHNHSPVRGSSYFHASPRLYGYSPVHSSPPTRESPPIQSNTYMHANPLTQDNPHMHGNSYLRGDSHMHSNAYIREGYRPETGMGSNVSPVPGVSSGSATAGSPTAPSATDSLYRPTSALRPSPAPAPGFHSGPASDSSPMMILAAAATAAAASPSALRTAAPSHHRDDGPATDGSAKPGKDDESDGSDGLFVSHTSVSRRY